MGQSGLVVDAPLPGEFVMPRIRLDGGQLTAGQLRAIGSVARRYARDNVEVTDQQHVRLGQVRIEDAPEAFTRLRAAGLAASPAGEHDAQQVFLGSPVAGIAADEIVDGTPALRAIRDRRSGRAEFSGLPRTFRTVISGSPRQDVLHEAGDVSFVGVRHPALGPGFDIWVGGGLPANLVMASRLGAFAAPREVADVWAAVVRAFRDYGYGRSRRDASLKSLIADWGVERFRHVVETEYLHRRLAGCLAPPAPAGPRDQVGVHVQRDGRCYVGITPLAARPGGATLVALADLAAAHGSARVRATPYRKFILLDIPPGRVESLCHGLERIGLTARPALSRRCALARARVKIAESGSHVLVPVRDLAGDPWPGRR